MVAVASKRILVFCDGTGQDGLIVPDGLAEGVHPEILFQHGVQAAMTVNGDGKQQIVLYQSGGGSEVDFCDTYIMGTTVLPNKIRDAYAFLAQNFQEGDEIFLFGFSRGAYAARKLASLIDRIGLLVPERLGVFVRIWKEIVDGECPSIPPETRIARIRCIGLWDTIGTVFQDIAALRLEDTGVPAGVDIALQALSIQENREHFRPILWTVPRYGLGRNQVLTQIWFPGAHGDIGGSYADSGISDITLFWMTGEITRRGLIDVNTDFIKRSRKSTANSWADSQPHNAYMETPSSRRQAIRPKNRYECDYMKPDSVFHRSWFHSPTELDNAKHMITRDTLQDAYGRDWEPIYAPLNNFEDECAEQWHYQLGVSSLVDEDIAALIGKGSIYWMSSEDGQGACHERGIHGGVDSNGSTVYIGRSSYKSGLHPGEVTQSLDGIYIPWGGKRVFLQEYEKLSGVVSAT
ncbi:hypothetical protein CERSUDRAFT_123873 [Gelatoporia subvermispora B]|uniref:T6SS Phospholipase effector Tle1-like catalytic domain-containing protein n=1 Tax=Ceriporiopsis subvermispora (strain B) TaxID=914234 RepID=M2QXI2_CERS8|nr:hypothetical protein CERSUDRAFT_123873 [Gelatoporia subvermispora B]